MSDPELGARPRSLGARLVPDSVRPRITALYRPLLYRGDAVACPCCGGRFRAFMEHRGQPDVRCPRCGAMNRHRLLWLWLHESTLLDRVGLRVLHVAPEWSLRKLLRGAPEVRYLSADLESGLADEHFDLTGIPHPDASFDLILCNHVLEHIPDDLAAMRELRRVLAPGGTAILMAPVGRGREETLEDPGVGSPAERLRVYGQEDHVRLYGADYADRLRAAGFDVFADRMLDRLGDEVIARHRLRPDNPRWDDDVVYVGRA